MKKIQMVDLKGQYQPIKEQVNQSIQEVIDTTAFINGPQVHEFQKELEEYLNVKHVIPCANGTDALQIAMMGLGLKPGDEVITADFTFAATVEVIALLQLTPVLVDVDPIDFNIDIEAIKKAITPKTKAIVPVHLFGKAANMDAILEIAEETSIGNDFTNQLSFIEHPENIELALKVCEEVGVKRDTVLKGILKSQPDPGALFILDIQYKKNKNKFVSAFAANDPSSTMKVWTLISKGRDNKKCIFLNTRNDRRYRTIQLIELVFNHIKPDLFIIRAHDIDSIIKNYSKSDIKLIIYDMETSPKKVVNNMNELNNYLIVGIGNMVGWGDDFMKEIKKFKVT